MSRMKLEPCPYCGEKVEDKWPNVVQISKERWSVCHYCDHPNGDLGMSINAYGSTKKEAVDRWNTRAASEELKFTREFIHEHGLEFEIASEWDKEKHDGK